MLTRRPYAALLARCPWVDEVLVDPALPRWRPDGWWRLQRQLRGRRFARVYDLQNSRRSRAYRRWLLRGIPASALDPACEFPADPALRRRPLPERLAAQLLAAGVPPRQASAPDLSWMPVPVARTARRGRCRRLLRGAAARRLPTPSGQALAALPVPRRPPGSPPASLAVTIPGPEEPEIGAGWPGIVLRAAGGRPLDPFELAGSAGTGGGGGGQRQRADPPRRPARAARRRALRGRESPARAHRPRPAPRGAARADAGRARSRGGGRGPVRSARVRRAVEATAPGSPSPPPA
ncbi:MAG: hypothetical protein RML12_04365 [Xanthomonadales bacterium]|nr:hypothetical protein [Xanthomonadales bacterium]